MILFVDANAIVADPLLAKPKWEAIGDAVRAEYLELFVTELAQSEAVTIYRKKCDAQGRSLRKEARSLPKEIRSTVEQAIKQLDTLSANYEERLASRLDGLGVEALPYPQSEHEFVSERARHRTAPFDERGSGYRDTLHWLSFLELVEDHFHDDDPTAYFVSHDEKAFGVPRQSKLIAEFEDRCEGWELHFLQSVEKFEVPGQFLPEQPDVGRYEETELENAVSDALTSGSFPKGFEREILRRFGFENVEVREIEEVNVDIGVAQKERVSGELSVTFTGHVRFRVHLETFEVYDEEMSDYEVLSSDTEVTAQFSGNARTDGGSFDEVSELNLEGLESQAFDFPH